MEASTLDLRYKMNSVLRALARNEIVKILYHGKIKGIIYPCKKNSKRDIKEHPFFNMTNDKNITVEEQMNRLPCESYDLSNCK